LILELACGKCTLGNGINNATAICLAAVGIIDSTEICSVGLEEMVERLEVGITLLGSIKHIVLTDEEAVLAVPDSSPLPKLEAHRIDLNLK